MSPVGIVINFEPILNVHMEQSKKDYYECSSSKIVQIKIL